MSLLAHIQQKFHGFVQVQSRCLSCWQLFHSVADTGLVSQTATGTEQMSGWDRCRRVPQAATGGQSRYLSPKEVWSSCHRQMQQAGAGWYRH